MHFGGYGFNKSHSTAYALVAFQTAYLKTHYPTEFMAAVLSSEMDGAERDKFFVEHIDDCRRMGIEVLLPNINEGQVDFRVASEGKIHFGLGAIKGVGFKAVEAIVKARESNGPFQSLDDFFERVRPGTWGAAAPRRWSGRALLTASMPANPTCCALSYFACCPGPSNRGRPSKRIGAAASAGCSTRSKRPALNGHSNGRPRPS